MKLSHEKAKPIWKGRAARGEIRQVLNDPSAKLELASYVADVTLELRNMTKKADMTFLSYLLEMAFQEAFDISQKLE